MKKINNLGFTLVELLAVIVIMGLIMSLSFPSIMRMIEGNDRKKYESYEKSMVEYAKAYYDEDTSNYVGLSELKNQGLTGIDEICVGYVDLNNYKAYLKCDDHYETNNFDINKAS